MTLPKSFSKPGALTPFHILAVQGQRGSGKTDIACRFPGPIAIQSWDYSTDGVVQKYMEEKEIYVAEYRVAIDLEADYALKRQHEDAGELAEKQADRIKAESWKPFRADYEALIANPEIRTIVWDTAGEANEVLRLANFGRLEKNPQLAYGPVNAEYKSLLRMALDHRKNLILTHHLTKKYKNVTDPQTGREKSVETDEWKMKGNVLTDNVAQSIVETSFEPAKGKREMAFRVEIKKARLNPEATGTVLENPDLPTLMMLLAPDVPGEAWL